MPQKQAIIIGAGPAGLTAAYELLQHTDIQPIVLEQSAYIGGLSRTILHNGNRIDIGGHRFFSKSDRVMNWWLKMLPLQTVSNSHISLAYQNKQQTLHANHHGVDPDKEDCVMLVRQRKSRIYFNQTFFDYPLQLNPATVKKIGFARTCKMGASYTKSMLFPVKNEKNLEDFFINRFGFELYQTFFKSYTEKVWGVSCKDISSEWGAQRIKGLSIKKAITHFFKSYLPARTTDFRQKETETSLIQQFLYPKFGPGQMWQEVAKKVTAAGGHIYNNTTAMQLDIHQNNITRVYAYNHHENNYMTFNADYVFSTMPVKELINALNTTVPSAVKAIADGLQYRDFITVGILAHNVMLQEPLTDNWIYIQEPDVLVGRIQLFNNWSPYLVADPSKVWLGLEYFCYETDALWRMSNEELINLAKTELEKLGLVAQKDVIDGIAIKVPKTYPAYFGVYDQFDTVKNYTDQFRNLYLIGRNGMHKYNNQDHSMLTAMTAVDNIVQGITTKENIWAVNTEQQYHESQS